jgi:eukaryotic-like serine/threonine-protein kinase
MTASAVDTTAALDLPTRFVLDREIGRGATAVVYRAHDQHLDRFVAIKVLSAQLSNTVGAERFQREIALMAKLVHPNIVALFDSGRSSDRLYYVMPFVAGETLRARISREERLVPHDAASLGADVAEALAYAHGAGIVHRDVKPENVFSVSGRAILADFGIARLMDAVANDGHDLTTGGRVLGTLAYMSPEQGAGDGPVDGRSDLYSLGCMLYELLCGQPPFTAPSALAVLGKHLTESPQPLAERGTSAPMALQQVVMQLLAKNAADRPETAADVARALRAVSYGSGSERRPGAPPPVPTRRVAVTALRHDVGDELCESIATAVASSVAASLSTVPGLSVLVRDQPSADLRVEGTVRRAGQRTRVAMRVVDSDGVLQWSAQIDGVIDEPFQLEDSVAAHVVGWFASQGAHATGSAARHSRTTGVGEADHLVAKAVHAINQFGPSGGAASIAYLQESRAYLTRALALEPQNARALCAMGNLVSIEGNCGLAPRAESLIAGRRYTYAALAADDQVAEVHTSMAKMALYNDDDVFLAARHGRCAVDLDPTDPETQRFWCIVCKITGRLDEAIDAARQGVELAPETAPMWNTLGDVLLAAGRNSEAIDALRRAIALLPNYVLAQERLERARRAHGETDLAVDLRVSRLRTMNLRDRAEQLESDAASLGAAAAIQRDLRRELDDLLVAAERGDPFADDFRRTVADRIASVYAELGDWHSAMDWVLRVYEHRPGRLRRMLTDMTVNFRGLAVDPRYTRLMRVAGLEELI